MATESGAVSGTAASETTQAAHRPYPGSWAIRAGAVPRRAGGHLYLSGAGVRQRAQLLVSPAPELRLRHPRRGDDVRDSHRRHRPISWLSARLRRTGRGRGGQRERLARRGQPGCRGNGCAHGSAGGDGRRRWRRPAPRVRHRQVESACLRRHVGRVSGVARRCTGPLPRRADQQVLR